MNRARFIIASLILATTSLAPSGVVSALSGSQFQAGHIIDDGVFYNSNSMSVQQVQDFLNSKVGTCDRNGTQPSEYGGGTRAQYGTAHGFPPPYTCLNGYYENPITHENNLDGRGAPAGGMSTAQIIIDAAQRYSINPQVLIVLLQKEQGLVTDQWPTDSQYRSATGYGCPDSGSCDANYYGLYNQVEDAAWQFQHYQQNPTAFNFWPNSNNSILWNPVTSCGSANVFIQNISTASLYDYTPYQPNQAALNNLYGLGDGCSSYGNRNFWRYFNDWFGSTLANKWSATYFAESGFPTVQAGKSASAYFMYRNTGSAAWHDGTNATPGLPAITLATTNPINRSSIFNSSWFSSNRPTINFAAVYESDGTTLASDQHTVQPGQIGKYQFTFSPPADLSPGVYREWFQPVAEGDSPWEMGGHVFLDVTVTPADYAAAFYRMSGYPTIQRGSDAIAYIDYKNIGTLTWYDNSSMPPGGNPIHLADGHPINRPSTFVGSDWNNDNRPTANFAAVFEANGSTPAANQHVAQPGQIARFAFHYKVPPTQATGTYQEWIQPVAEGSSNWNMGADGYFIINVTAPTNGLLFHGFSGYPTVAHGNATTVTIDYQNIGTSTLYDGTTGGAHPTNLADTAPINRTSPFADNSWLNNNRPAGSFNKVFEADGTTLAADQHHAAPGQIIRYQYVYNIPSSQAAGTYREFIQPVLEMSQPWDLGGFGFFDITVQ